MRQACWLVLVVLSLAVPVWAAEVPSDYACLRFLPAKNPSVYIEFRGNQMRMAKSPEDLKKATWVEAEKLDKLNLSNANILEYYTFPEQAIPSPIPGVTSARVQLVYEPVRPNPEAADAAAPDTPVYEAASITSSFYGRGSFELPDATKTTWKFVTYASGQVNAERKWEYDNTARFPDLHTLGLIIETDPDEKDPHKVGIGIRLWGAGDLKSIEQIVIREAWKADQSVPLHLVVTNEQKEAIAEQDGDLNTFGFT